MRNSLLCFCIFSVVSFAQSFTGSIRGTVTDSQGAVVPNAKVTLTNTATNTASQTETIADGIFVFGCVVPANYDVSVQKSKRTASCCLLSRLASLSPCIHRAWPNHQNGRLDCPTLG